MCDTVPLCPLPSASKFFAALKNTTDASLSTALKWIASSNTPLKTKYEATVIVKFISHAKRHKSFYTLSFQCALADPVPGSLA